MEHAVIPLVIENNYYRREFNGNYRTKEDQANVSRQDNTLTLKLITAVNQH